MSASASGSSAANGTAHNRKSQPSSSSTSTPSSSHTHIDGSSTRAYTTEQKAAVIRVRRCQPTAFYEILGVESEKTTIDENGIKRAYRKLSLLTHPDKNGYQGADEAFKMVSRAFQILGDADKRRMFDQTGGDPDSRSGGGGGGGGQSPFAGFARSGGMGGGMGRGFEAEISPEELFRQFFGGGMGGGFGSPFGGGLFDTGPGFVFNMGGPGIRVHQFGGPRPRRRPDGTAQADPNAPPRTALSALTNLLPLILLFILPILSSLFGGSDSTPSHPKFSIDTPAPPLYTARHTSGSLGVPYYVEPAVAERYTAKEWRRLDKVVETQLARQLNYQCSREIEEREELVRRAQGWFSVDQELMGQAQAMEMGSCRRMQRYGMSRY